MMEIIEILCDVLAVLVEARVALFLWFVGIMAVIVIGIAIACCMYSDASLAKDCAAKGGEYVTTQSKNICVAKSAIIK